MLAIALSVLVGGVVLTWLLTGRVRAYALRRGVLDHPGDRRSHQQATPRGGGIAIVAALVAIWLGLFLHGDIDGRLGLALALAAGVLGLLGWLDDHRDLSARARLAVQVGVAAAVVGVLGPPEVLTLGPLALPSSGLAAVAWGLALVWLTNLYNFMDGIDGLAGVQAVFCAGVVAVAAATSGHTGLGLAALAVAAASIGFLPWNVPRARIFMGDAGSAALGMVLGVLLLAADGRGVLSTTAALVLLGVFGVDATATLIWRFLKGDQWYTAHREHAYQRLVRIGAGHMQVTLGAMAINLVFILPLLAWSRGDATRETWALAIAWLALLAIWSYTRTLDMSRSRS